MSEQKREFIASFGDGYVEQRECMFDDCESIWFVCPDGTEMEIWADETPPEDKIWRRDIGELFALAFELGSRWGRTKP